MAALSPDQTRAGAAGVAISTPEAQAIPRPGRYEIDISGLGSGPEPSHELKKSARTGASAPGFTSCV
jgi:hypothetical protein